MKSRGLADCGCGRRFEAKGSKSGGLGLDELMIVNPGSGRVDGLLLGEDGAAYRVEGLAEQDETRGLGRFFLGEDGTLYRAEELRHGRSEQANVRSGNGVRQAKELGLGDYFLGADGTLYEVIE